MEASTWSSNGITVSTTQSLGTWGTIGGGCTFGTSSGLDFTVQVMAVSTSAANSYHMMVGIEKEPFSTTTDAYASANGYMFIAGTGYKMNNGVASLYSLPWNTVGYTVRVVLSNSNLTFYINGVNQGAAFTGLSGTYRGVISMVNEGAGANSLKLIAGSP